MTGTEMQQYEATRDEAKAAYLNSESELALQKFDDAVQIARALGDQELIDQAICNRAGVTIDLEAASVADEMRELHRILLRTCNPTLSYYAAYHLGFGYDLRKDLKKALFYARIALHNSQALELPSKTASAHNLVGRVLLAQNQIDEAREHFIRVLDLLHAAEGDEIELRRAAALDNLGYCEIIRKEFSEGFRHLFGALRAGRRSGVAFCKPTIHVSLCFAYLEVGKLRAAHLHGERALDLAAKLDIREMIKMSLFLLGEVYKQGGDLLRAQELFEKLQGDHYPDSPGVADLLLVVDARQLVNIKG